MSTKILVIGHSWVNQLFESYKRYWFPKMDTKVEFVQYIEATLSTLELKISKCLNDSYSYLVVFVLLSEAYTFRELGSGETVESYQVMIPDPDFSLDSFLNRYKQFQRKCKEIHPKIKLILIIPPLLDLVAQHQKVVKRCATAIRDNYEKNEELREVLYNAARDRHAVLQRLKSDEFEWPEKEGGYYDLTDAAISSMSGHKAFQSFIEGKITTMNSDRYLVNGIRPTPRVWKYMWKGLISLIRTKEISNEPPVISTSSKPQKISHTTNQDVEVVKELSVSVDIPISPPQKELHFSTPSTSKPSASRQHKRGVSSPSPRKRKQSKPKL